MCHLLSHATARPEHPSYHRGEYDTQPCGYSPNHCAVRRAACTPWRDAGDRVGLALRDTADHLLLHYAVAWLGATIVPIDHRWAVPEKVSVVRAFSCRCTAVEPGDPAAAQIAGLTFEPAWRDGPACAAPPVDDENLPVMLSLSSGTTGRPSGSLVSHRELYERWISQWVGIGFNGMDRYLAATPLYFGAGRSFGMSCSGCGRDRRLLPSNTVPVRGAAGKGNEGRSRSTAQGWSFRWYTGDPDLSVLHDPDLRLALTQSLRLAAIAVIVTVPLGLALAVGLTRWRGRGSGTARGISLATLVTPEIVMGTALLLVFVHLLTFIKLGTVAQAIGHITFSLVFVVIIVRGRLLAIGPEYEEAARDLGASRIQALRLALLPMLVPAIVASGIIVFAISMDDFVISAFLSSGTATDTVPVRIYATGRTAPTPALNALATLTLVITS